MRHATGRALTLSRPQVAGIYPINLRVYNLCIH